MSNYRQSSGYVVPYSGAVPGLVSSRYSDHFAGGTPQLFDASGNAVRGYQAFDPRWQVQSSTPGAVVRAGVNASIGMAELTCSAAPPEVEPNAWITLAQPLPVPQALGDVVEYAIYARTMASLAPPLSALAGGAAFMDVGWYMQHGLFVALDSAMEFPEAIGFEQNLSEFYELYEACGSITGEDRWDFVAMDTYGNTPRSYWRIRVYNDSNGAASLLRVSFEMGTNGLDWIPMQAYELQAEGLSMGYGGMMFRLEPGPFQVRPLVGSCLVDFFELVPQPWADTRSYIGGLQQLGAV